MRSRFVRRTADEGDRDVARQLAPPDPSGIAPFERRAMIAACYCMYFIFASLIQASFALPDRLSQRSLAAL